MTSAPETPDPRPLQERAADQLAELIRSARPEQLANRTPCVDWDVRALLNHVVEATGRFASLGEGGDGTVMAPPEPLTGIPDDGWSEAYAEARGRLAAAWAEDAKLAGTYTVPWGTVPGGIALSGLLMDSVTHTWDLARGLGGGQDLDPELARAALGVARQAVPAERRGGATPFEPVRGAPADADAYGQLAAWLGREVT